MPQRSKASSEEKVDIVRGCLKGDWSMEEAGLEDRRGKRKKDQTPRTELERAQIEIEQLKHKLYPSEMENALLKNWTR